MSTNRHGLCENGECERKAEFALYPDFSTYNASAYNRPHISICGHCAVALLDAKRAERVSPFALVKSVNR